MRKTATAIVVLTLFIGSLAWAQGTFIHRRAGVQPAEEPVMASGQVTFPDGSVGNVIVAFVRLNNINSAGYLFQTIPDATGRGMKTQLSSFGNGVTTPVNQGTIAFVNP